MSAGWIDRAREAVAGRYGDILPHVEAVVAHCEDLTARYPDADREVVLVAAWFHDLGRVDGPVEDHAERSARLAREFLSARGYDPGRANLVAWTVFHHTAPVYSPERDRVPLEARILYDADKIDRADGLYLAQLLINLGGRPDGEAWPVQLRWVREQYVGLYESLYTERAREVAGPGYEVALEFLDRVMRRLGEGRTR